MAVTPYPGDGYITADEFRATETGIDLTGIDDTALGKITAVASRMAEEEAGASWVSGVSYTERHEWRFASRRVYVRNWPVTAITGAKIYIGADVYATLTVSDFVINNEQRYLELASLASATSLTPELLTLGLAEPIIEVTYTAGLSTVPYRVKLAVALITGAHILQRRLLEDGVGGVRSFSIGSYAVMVGKGDGEGAGFAGLVPDAAKKLLRRYKMTYVR